MRINSLALNNFRNHTNLELNFVGNTSTLVGRNGRGKTNIVEAVNYFATLGSHRGAAAAPEAGVDRKPAAARHRGNHPQDAATRRTRHLLCA